jgi:hypothetical protein
VPAAPASTYTTNPLQTYYAFPAFQTGRHETSHILQPVLQFGNNGTWGGQYWTAASWWCDGTDCYASEQHLTVYPGDLIWGLAGSNDCSGGYCDWSVITRDMTQGHTGQSNYSVRDTIAYDWGVGGAVEVYNLSTSCDLYPASGVFYYDISMQDRYGSMSPTWTGVANDPVPHCSFAVTSTSATVNLYHNIQSLSNSISQDSSYFYSARPSGGYPPYVASYWEVCGLDCFGGGGDLVAREGGGVGPNTIAHGWQFLSTDWTVYWDISQRWLRSTVTDSQNQQAIATYHIE